MVSDSLFCLLYGVPSTLGRITWYTGPFRVGVCIARNSYTVGRAAFLEFSGKREFYPTVGRAAFLEFSGKREFYPPVGLGVFGDSAQKNKRF